MVTANYHEVHSYQITHLKVIGVQVFVFHHNIDMYICEYLLVDGRKPVGAADPPPLVYSQHYDHP